MKKQEKLVIKRADLPKKRSGIHPTKRITSKKDKVKRARKPKHPEDYPKGRLYCPHCERPF